EAIDCTSLPGKLRYVRLRTVDQVCNSIRKMQVRGAPLIGVVGAYGLVLAAQKTKEKNLDVARSKLRKYADRLIGTRPTGVNLRWAVERVYQASNRVSSSNQLEMELRREADAILHEELEAAHKIGQYGRELIDDNDTVLTHCNAGALATAGYGTALALVRSAIEQGKHVKVIATETRPLLQGSRLTAFELSRDHIPVTLVCDSAVGQLMSRGMIDKVVVGADRILRTGHVANKIGTLQVALAAKFFSVPFYVAAPTSTIDLTTSPSSIVIEERDPDEVLYVAGHRLAPRGVGALNPAFDLTPPELVTGIVTNRGIVRPPFSEGFEKILS
ncbi:MAG TPA: S-methyl-5-thioribose-1-phosphate isomerase, partial [Candidatus Binatus sp.]|nr:S-methyl-5-thioribose-1-phosphate isomerase [Candidatus Binatus sp.]